MSRLRAVLSGIPDHRGRCGFYDTVSTSKGGKGRGKERSKESEEYLQMVK